MWDKTWTEHIFLSVTHDTGRHVAPLRRGGRYAPTCPAWLRKAAEQFFLAYCTAPQCSPRASASFLTGLVLTRHGKLIGLTLLLFLPAPLGVPTLPCRLLGNAGYETHLSGFQYEQRDALHPSPVTHKAVSNVESKPATVGNRRARVSRTSPRPFLCHVGLAGRCTRFFPGARAASGAPGGGAAPFARREAVGAATAGLQEAVCRFDAVRWRHPASSRRALSWSERLHFLGPVHDRPSSRHRLLPRAAKGDPI